MIENNRLIAEFLGWEQFGSIGLYDTTFHNNTGSLHWLTKNMRFHNDWNWLMEVVNFIEEMEINNNTFTFEIQKENVTIFQYGTYNMEIIVTEGGTRLENLYNAVSQWIELFNKNKF